MLCKQISFQNAEFWNEIWKKIVFFKLYFLLFGLIRENRALYRFYCDLLCPSRILMDSRAKAHHFGVIKT